MNRVSDVVERNVVSKYVQPVTVDANAGATLVPDSTGAIQDGPFNRDEIAFIHIFNAEAVGSGKNLYYNYGAECDNVNNFLAYIQPGQMLDVKTRQKVTAFNPNGTTVKVAITLLVRNAATSNNT